MHNTLFRLRSTIGLILLEVLVFAQVAGAQGSSYSSFSDWPLVKLKGGLLVCTDYQNNQDAFIENFDNESLFDTRWDRLAGSDPIQGTFHGAACDNLFVTANVELVPIAPGSSDKILHLTTRKEDQPVTVPGFNNGPPGPGNGWACLPPGIQDVTRDFTAGAIHMKEPFKYNLGRYEIVCKMPLKNNVWSTFWMWHHDEIDIMDIGYYGKFSQNVFHGDYVASLQDSPCCPHMVGCNYCDDIVDHVDCSAYANCGVCNEQNPQEVPYDCSYMANGNWHTIGCEWTPYKVMFYVDNVVTGTVYRYYYPDKTPVIIECGGIIPDAVVRENPAFLDIKERYFQPIVWIVAEGDDDCPGPGNCNQPEDLPATLEVKEISIRERAYQRVALSGCFDLCDAGDVCLDFEFENLNGLYGTEQGVVHVDPIPDPSLNNCQVISKGNGSGVVTECGPDEVCFTYDAAGCQKPEGCIGVRANLGYPSPLNNLSLTKWLNPKKPEVFSQCSGITVSPRDQPTGPKCVCVDPGTTCNLTVTVDGTATDLSYADGLTCFNINGPCSPVSIFYEHCGEIQFEEATATNWGLPLQAMLTPHLIYSYGEIPLDQGITYINTSYINMCYLSSAVQIIFAQVNKDGNNQYLTNFNGQCLSLTNINSYADVTIQIAIEGCGIFTQHYRFIRSRGEYRFSPNPTTGMVTLEIVGQAPESENGNGDAAPRPVRLTVMDARGQVITNLDISTGASSYSINLSSQPAGSYQAVVQDANLPEPLIYSIQKY